MFRVGAMFTGFSLLLLISRAFGDDATSILEKLNDAKARYRARLDDCRDEVQKQLDFREKNARSKGDKEAVDQIKNARKEFSENGKLPAIVSARTTRKLESAIAELIRAYDSAIMEFTKAGLDKNADESQRELENFQSHRATVFADVAKWEPLFNGKDLTGWKQLPGDRSNWMVDSNGWITGTGKGNLVTQRDDYSNFRLSVRAMIESESNSGVFIRMKDRRGGYEAAINNLQTDPIKTGGLFIFLPNSRLSDAQRIPSALQMLPPNEWFNLDIEANDNSISVWVNGEKASGFTDPNMDDKQISTSGCIWLQAHSGTVRFSKIEIMESKKSTN